MKEILLVILGVVSFALLVLIALQEPKEEGLGAIGGSANIFHGRSPRSQALDKAIIAVGVAFVLLVIVTTVVK